MAKRLIRGCVKVVLTGAMGIAFLGWVLSGFGSGAAAGELTAREIIDRMDESLSSESREATMEMVIVNVRGQERRRTIRFYTTTTREFDAGLVVFLEPADVRGTSFLTRDDGDGDNMWLYMPAVGSVRRIASQDRSERFMGTDFTNEDMGMLGAADYRDRYSSELLGREELEGIECYVLEAVPTEEEIDYSRLKMWVRREDFMPLKIEFYDPDGELLKVMTNSDIREIEGYLTPHRVEMKNVQEGTKTLLTMSEVEYDLEVPEEMFTTRYMQRALD